MITLHYGMNGVRKTSAALSDGCWHAELDAGSLERAWTHGLSITSRRFFAPTTSLLDRGSLSGSMMGQSGKGAVQFVHRYKGWDEKWIEFVQWFYEWIKDSSNSDLIVDTETKLWDLAQNAVRQRIQDEFPAEMVGDRLKRLEYQEPNSYMHGLIEEAKNAGKNLTFIAHEGSVWMGDQYNGPPIPKPDGWKEIQDEMDMVIRFTRDRETHKSYATFEKCSQFEPFLGMKVEDPTYAKIHELLDAGAKLQAAGQPVPPEYSQVLVKAALV